MKKIIAFTLLVLFNNIAFSEEEKESLDEAPKSYLVNLLSECKEYASQEDIAAENLNTYLLACINEELEASYYKLITTLPTEG